MIPNIASDVGSRETHDSDAALPNWNRRGFCSLVDHICFVFGIGRVGAGSAAVFAELPESVYTQQSSAVCHSAAPAVYT